MYTFLDVACGIFFLFALKLWFQHKGSLPPGPKGWPILGNVFDMPTEKAWLTFTEWSYGDIMSLKLLGQPVIIVNSPKLVVEMLDKKGQIYSDRPQLEMASNLIGFKRMTGFMGFGSTFRAHRRLFHQVLGTRSTTAQFLPMIETQATQFLRDVVDSPDEVVNHIRHSAGALILMMSYGYEVKPNNDPIVDLLDKTVKHFSESSQPGAFFVDIIPALKYVPSWFPGAGFKRKAVVWAQDVLDTVNVPFYFVKQQMAAGSARSSFVSNLLERENKSEEMSEMIKWSASTLYTGGGDTTVSLMHSFILAMTLYPNVQKRAQAEIDSVVGPYRLPTFADRENLPYVNAIVLEALRWHPVGPLGIPHRVMQDDVQNGYLIPKGSYIIPNIWKMTHDPNVYADPMSFEPSRFLPSEYKAPERNPSDFVFGFGRRICPGIHLADASVFMSCAMLLATFDIEKAVENGTVVEPLHDYTSGTVSHPKSFRFSIKPRSDQAQALIRTTTD